MPKRSKKLRGAGFLDFLKPVGNFLKNSKIISSIAPLIPLPGASTIGKVAGAVGLGRKRRRGRKQKGRGAVRF